MLRDCQAGAGVLALANIPAEALRERRHPPGVLPVIGARDPGPRRSAPRRRSNIVLRGRPARAHRRGAARQEPYRLVRAERLAEPERTR